MVKTIVGLDLAATLQRGKVGIAVIQNQKEIFSLNSTQLVKSTWEILSIIDDEAAQTPVILAIDAPLKLPLSNDSLETDAVELETQWPMVYTYRPWEYLVFEKLKKEYGVSGRPFSSLTLTHRGQVLKMLLERKGWKLISSPDQFTDRCFTEVFPNLTMNILDLRRLGGKDERRRKFVSRLFTDGYHGMCLENETGEQLDAFMDKEDILDAIICAWTGALFLQSLVQPKLAVCLGDDRYGFVICP